jgi:hypothetical protein
VLVFALMSVLMSVLMFPIVSTRVSRHRPRRCGVSATG